MSRKSTTSGIGGKDRRATQLHATEAGYAPQAAVGSIVDMPGVAGLPFVTNTFSWEIATIRLALPLKVTLLATTHEDATEENKQARPKTATPSLCSITSTTAATITVSND